MTTTRVLSRTAVSPLCHRSGRLLRAAASRAISAALTCMLSGFAWLAPLVAQARQGPPQPRPGSIGDVAAEYPERFADYAGRKLGERFTVGNGRPEPGRWVMDVRGAAQGTGTYQLVIQQSGVWQLVNEDRTLAARGRFDASCAPKLVLEDRERVFATIEIRRGTVADVAALRPEFLGYDPAPAPAYFLLTQDGQTYQSLPVRFMNFGNTLVPQQFKLRGAKGEEVDVRFRKEDIEVRHKNRRVLDERAVVSLAQVWNQLPYLLGLDSERPAEARQKCF